MSESTTRTRRSIKFAWPHDLAIHRFLVRLYNRVLALVPFGIKYGLGARRRKKLPPYSLLSPSSTSVQVGSPSDTLHAGRSRGMYFSLLSGRSVVVEPDPHSAQEFARLAAARGLDGVSVVNSGAWSADGSLRLYVDPTHPASSFTEGTMERSPEMLARYQVIDVPSRPLDSILGELGVTEIAVLSLTTNGGEVEMLVGAAETLKNTRYVCVREGCPEGVKHLEDLGFEFYSYDDRGVTLARKGA